MGKGKRIKKVLLTIIIVVAVLFAVWNAVWLFYRWTYFDKIGKNNPDYSVMEVGLWEFPMSYVAHIYDEDGVAVYGLGVHCPGYLRFIGNYFIGSSLVLDADNTVQSEYSIDISIKPQLTGGMRFQFRITDYTDDKKEYFFETNEDMELIWGDSGEMEEIFGKAGDQINEMIEIAKEKFCID